MRIVVKVGSNILTRSDGKPNVTNMSALVDQIAQLHGKGHQVVLVSSGAVACGRGSITPDHPLDSVAARQLFSSIGQIRLINYYSRLFSEYGIVVGQVLTQKENFSSPTSYENQQQCIMEAGKYAQEFNAQLSESEENKVLDQLKADGCNVVEVTDKQVWADACAKVIEDNTKDQAELYQQLKDFAQ